jgi:CRAL/TRIO, N-terminal domain
MLTSPLPWCPILWEEWLDHDADLCGTRSEEKVTDLDSRPSLLHARAWLAIQRNSFATNTDSFFSLLDLSIRVWTPCCIVAADYPDTNYSLQLGTRRYITLPTSDSTKIDALVVPHCRRRNSHSCPPAQSLLSPSQPLRTSSISFTSKVSANQATSDDSASALPRHHRYFEMPVPPGHLGNLTPEQELKLREFWSLTLKTLGVKDPSLTPAAPRIATISPTSSEPNTDTETTNPTKKSSGKKRHSLFSSKKHHNDDSDAQSNHSAPGAGDEDDKYGQTKEFQQTLKELTPEELHSAFWSMVKSDHPDALLLRFLRARKWDVQRALVMLVSTMRWRSKEIQGGYRRWTLGLRFGRLGW